MLSSSVFIAFLRNTINLSGIIFLFLSLDRPRFSPKKTAIIYLIFALFVLLGSTSWYVLSWETYLIWVAPISFFISSVFSILMSSTPLVISTYTLAIAFFTTTFYMACGIYLSTYLFSGNIWADITVRFLLLIFFIWIFHTKFRSLFLQATALLSSKDKLFSLIALVSSLFLPVFSSIKYKTSFESPFINFLMLLIPILVSLMQYTIFRLFVQTNQTFSFKRKSELHEINAQLLQRQLEMLEESVKEASRIRHDARHHNLQITEYVHNGELDELLTYLQHYEKESQRHLPIRLCENLAANNILNAYAHKAKQNDIAVKFDISIAKNIGIKDIDIVAILANIMENAILGCIHSEHPEQFIELFVGQKASKLVIQSRNSSNIDIIFENGQPKSKHRKGIGVSSILYSAGNYNGETDFQNNNGVFICRVLLKIPLKI